MTINRQTSINIASTSWQHTVRSEDVSGQREIASLKFAFTYSCTFYTAETGS